MAWISNHEDAPLVDGRRTIHHEVISIPREEEGEPPLLVTIKVTTAEAWKTGLQKATAEELLTIWNSQGYQVTMEPIGGGGWKVTRYSETRELA